MFFKAGEPLDLWKAMILGMSGMSARVNPRDQVWEAVVVKGGCCLVAKSRPPLCDPTGLLCPWDFPGKNTGVGCHFLLQGSSRPRDQTQVSCTCRQILYC